MRILLLRTWISNIGNGFIDKGAKVAINKAFPDSEIIEVSGHPNYIADRYELGKLKSTVENQMPFSFEQEEKTARERIVNVGEFVDVDLAVLPGCTLYEHVFRKYEKTIDILHEKDIPLLLLGSGGGDYSVQTQRYMKDKLEKYNVAGLISRDQTAYDCYSDIVEQSYSGIDCAFFINDWYQPPDSTESFTTFTFDKQKEPSISTDKKIIRPHHEPFDNPFLGIPKRILQRVLPRYTYISEDVDPIFFKQDNTFMSDLLEDYLFFYSNTAETHSDRVHACIPTLVYGNPAKFHYETPRANLFEQVLDEDIFSERVTLDQSKLEREKEKQIDAISQFIKSAV